MRHLEEASRRADTASIIFATAAAVAIVVSFAFCDFGGPMRAEVQRLGIFLMLASIAGRP